MLIGCLAALSVVPLAAHAQSAFDRALEPALRLFQDLEYEPALEQLQDARRLASNDGQEVRVYLLEGIILGHMGDKRRDQALAAFKRALRVNPKAELPFKVPPKVESIFEEARKQVLAELIPPNPTVKVVPPEPPAPDPFPKGVAGQSRGRVPVTPLVFAGVSVVSAGVGAVFGLQSRSNASKVREAYTGGLPPAADVGALGSRLDDAHGQARTANVLFGTAALAAGGAVVTWLLNSGDSAAKPEEKH
jgi:tetratricopeptide (TPR) repeat protein